MPRSSTTGGKAAASAPDELPFEQAIEKLEGIVERLEDGELDLEASLEAFEEGVSLSKRCAGQLEAAERRIEILVKEGGETLARPFDEAADDGSDASDGANGAGGAARSGKANGDAD